MKPDLLRLSLTLTRRDWRAGELRMLLLALLVAVASIASVGFFVDRMRQALSLEARQLLGADLVLTSAHPFDEALSADARRRGLSVATTVNFPSMVVADGRPQLAAVKAVSEAYPLRGGLRAAAAPNAPDAPVTGIPMPGTVWADAQLVQTLGLKVGARVELGDAAFTIDRIITLEPDRGTSFVNFAPRALIRLDELASTGLVQPASRVTWRLLVAGDPREVRDFEAAVRARVENGLKIESVDNARPEMRGTLDRAERFLALVALLSALIAAVAIALAARRFAERHLDGCAVMRAIGVRQRTLLTLLGLELLWVGLAGGVLGAALGWGVHFALVRAIAPLVGLPLPLPGVWPALQSVAAGLVLLMGFGAWPFMRLAGVPPLRVLRRELGAPGASPWIGAVLALAAFSALLLWFAGDRRLAAIGLGGFAAGALVFSGVVWAVLALLDPVRRTSTIARSPALRLALASWSRRRAASVAQTVAIAIGMMALMLLTVTRTDLVEGWRRASPPDAPNRFVINIQPDQRAGVERLLTDAKIENPELYPMVRGRLLEVNGRPVTPDDYVDERARRLVDREFNLSYMAEPPAHNRIVEGRWFAPGAMEASVEQGILGTLALSVGDRLTFDVGGERIQVTATSVRKLAWDSMKVNFFVILSPQALEAAPQTLITAYHQPPGAAPVEGRLVAEYPNLTVFDTGNIVRQIQSMLDQVVAAVQFLFLLTLAAGIVVLYTALAASRDERVREAALMRALGASRAQLARAQMIELALSGGLAGLLAAAGALAVGQVLAVQVFQFEVLPRWSSLGWGTAAGALLAVAAGWLSLRAVLRAPPLATLRAA